MLFLLMHVLRHYVFGSDLISAPFTFCLSYFLGLQLLFLACSYLVVLLLVSEGTILPVPLNS